MNRIFSVNFRFKEIPTIYAGPAYEDKFSEIGDWLRFTTFSWYVSTNLNPTQIRDKLRLVMGPEDHVVVLEVNTQGADGWAVPAIWDWLRSKSN